MFKSIKRIKRFVKRNFKNVVTAYVVGMLPATAVTTAITTQSSLAPNQIVNTIAKGGLPNILTWGTFSPMLSGAQQLVGQAGKVMGDTLNNEQVKQWGSDLQSKASEWWNAGSNAVSQLTKGQSSNVQTKEGIVENWNANIAPNYYRIIGKSEIDVSQFGSPGVINYLNLDHLNRARGAYAHLNESIVSDEQNEERESFTSNPAGWYTQSRDEKSKVEIASTISHKPYKGYMWNRSHLIADSLGGEATARNSVTATRMQNVGERNSGGMAYIESKLRKFYENGSNSHVTIYYQVIPSYLNNELLPRYVRVDVRSSDNSIDESIIVYNAANGYEIDYSNARNYRKIK